MKYNFYFHDDFDGVASSAILLYFFTERGDRAASYHPVQFVPGLKEGWRERRFEQPTVLVDFLYHPSVGWWFDHHPTSFLYEGWRNTFRDTMTTRFDDTFPSCAGLVAYHLEQIFQIQFPDFIRELIECADMIDSAGYPSAEYFLTAQHSGLQIANALGEKMPRDFFIEHLAEQSLSEVAKNHQVQEIHARTVKRFEHAKDVISDITERRGCIAIVSAYRVPESVPRFIEDYAFPDIHYSIVITRHGEIYKVGVGLNPWNPPHNPPHIGKLLEKYGGGGHARVGATEVTTPEDAYSIIHEIQDILIHHE
jgi:hypothetical protein